MRPESETLLPYELPSMTCRLPSGPYHDPINKDIGLQDPEAAFVIPFVGWFESYAQSPPGKKPALMQEAATHILRYPQELIPFFETVRAIGTPESFGGSDYRNATHEAQNTIVPLMSKMAEEHAVESRNDMGYIGFWMRHLKDDPEHKRTTKTRLSASSLEDILPRASWEVIAALNRGITKKDERDSSQRQRDYFDLMYTMTRCALKDPKIMDALFTIITITTNIDSPNLAFLYTGFYSPDPYVRQKAFQIQAVISTYMSANKPKEKMMEGSVTTRMKYAYQKHPTGRKFMQETEARYPELFKECDDFFNQVFYQLLGSKYDSEEGYFASPSPFVRNVFASDPIWYELAEYYHKTTGITSIPITFPEGYTRFVFVKDGSSRALAETIVRSVWAKQNASPHPQSIADALTHLKLSYQRTEQDMAMVNGAVLDFPESIMDVPKVGWMPVNIQMGPNTITFLVDATGRIFLRDTNEFNLADESREMWEQTIRRKQRTILVSELKNAKLAATDAKEVAYWLSVLHPELRDSTNWDLKYKVVQPLNVKIHEATRSIPADGVNLHIGKAYQAPYAPFNQITFTPNKNGAQVIINLGKSTLTCVINRRLELCDIHGNLLELTDAEKTYWKALIYPQVRNLLCKPEENLSPDDPDKQSSDTEERRRQRVHDKLVNASSSGSLRIQTKHERERFRGFTHDAQAKAFLVPPLRLTDRDNDLKRINTELGRTPEIGMVTYVEPLKVSAERLRKKRKPTKLYIKAETEATIQILATDSYYAEETITNAPATIE